MPAVATWWPLSHTPAAQHSHFRPARLCSLPMVPAVPVLACLRAQATAFWGLSLNEHSDALMASETVLFSSFTSEDDPHIDLKRMASGSAWSMSHALWGTARRSGRQGAWAYALLWIHIYL